MPNSSDETSPPNEDPFEDPFAETDSAEERVYGVLLQTRAPSATAAIADRADCDPKTARKYLRWFAKLGVATEHDGEPITYERNDRYFEWRRVNELASAYSRSELQGRVQELLERTRTYEDRYDAAHPGDVDALHPPEDISTESAFTDLADWQTVRKQLRRHERARRLRTDDPDIAV